MNGPSAARPSRETRRRLILDRSADLFAARGYAAIGVADIGAAVGITASGVYRYFEGKGAILSSLLLEQSDRMQHHAEQVQASCADPTRALEELVRWHAREAVERSGVFAVYRREVHALPPADQTRFRETRRAYSAVWTRTVVAARPDLDLAQVRVLVLGALALLNGAGEFRSPLGDGCQADLTARQALAALQVGVGLCAQPSAPPQYSPG